MTIFSAFSHKIQSNRSIYSFWNCSSSKEEKARDIPCALNHTRCFLNEANCSGLMSLILQRSYDMSMQLGFAVSVLVPFEKEQVIYCAVYPPSITTAWPVIPFFADEASR
jgi:thymidylate synthase